MLDILMLMWNINETMTKILNVIVGFYELVLGIPKYSSIFSIF